MNIEVLKKAKNSASNPAVSWGHDILWVPSYSLF